MANNPIHFLSPAECYDLIFRRWEEEATRVANLLREVVWLFESGDDPLSLPAQEPSDILSPEYAAYRAAMAPLQARVDACPVDESRGFERARGVLAADVGVAVESARTSNAPYCLRPSEDDWYCHHADCAAMRAESLPSRVTCAVVGHAPDCKCATL